MNPEKIQCIQDLYDFNTYSNYRFLRKKQKSSHVLPARKLEKKIPKTEPTKELEELKKKYNFIAADSNKFQVRR